MYSNYFASIEKRHSAPTIHNMRSDFSNINIIFIDEITRSMASASQLQMMDNRLRTIGDPLKVLDGFSVCVCGDIFQLNPVGRESCFSRAAYTYVTITTSLAKFCILSINNSKTTNRQNIFR